MDNGKVVLAIPQDIYLTLPNNKDGYGNVINNEFRSDFNDESLYITGRYDSKMIMEDGNIYLSINSVGTLDGKEVYGDNEPEEMKRLLGMIDKNCIEIKSNTTKVIENNSNTPNSETNNISVTQATAKSVNI